MPSYKTISRKILILSIAIFSSFPPLVKSQAYYSSSEIQQALTKLNVLGSALYIAAHPDDENTAVLAYLSRGRQVRTAYLSLTRGDGGQNLLGPEQGPLLGVIRTQELLAARRMDGAEQFFSLAVDFGYSKTAQETLQKWDRDIILGDMVKVIRQFRPDVIITRFSDRNGGHGHHLASAMLAEEAFHAAADPERYPDQLDDLQTWQAKRIYWNTWMPGNQAISIDIGKYNPVLGLSYPEISAAGRSMHKSQGFGSAAGRSSQLTFFDYTAGDTAKSTLFDGLDLSWQRIKGGPKIEKLISAAIQKYQPGHPHKIIPDLVKIYKALDKTGDHFWADIKKNEIKELIRMCSGLWLEAIVWQAGASPGSEITVRTQAINRSPLPVRLLKIQTTFAATDTAINAGLDFLKPLSVKQTLRIPDDAPYSQPYWLVNQNDGNMFTVTDKNNIGRAESDPALTSRFKLELYDSVFEYDVPVRFRQVDPVKGELYQPFIIRPELSLQIENPGYIFPDNKVQDIRVSIEANDADLNGTLFAKAAPGWSINPQEISFDLSDKGDKKTFLFQVSAQPGAQSTDLLFSAGIGRGTLSQQVIGIDYPHIHPQTVLQTSKTRLVKLDIKTDTKTIAYIMGSGDKIPQALSQLGYPVTLLSDDDLINRDLSEFDVIICGVRAFNTRDILEIQQKRLIDFVENGGTWIVQHNTRFGNQVSQIGPYPFTARGRDRISEEDAAIQILMPEHPVLNFPNKISGQDFEGWVQERGLYFAESWEGKLYPLLAGNDKGEPSKLGGLLYANYGKGVFMYTAYSWFRQLPAGVPGAYRLFVNMISAKGKQ